jgi:hypothetical protein
MTQRGAWTPEKVRQRIQAGVLVRRLTDHVLGKLEMTASQVRAAEVLLRKSVPDLQSVEGTLDVTARVTVGFTDRVKRL